MAHTVLFLLKLSYCCSVNAFISIHTTLQLRHRSMSSTASVNTSPHVLVSWPLMQHVAKAAVMRSRQFVCFSSFFRRCRQCTGSDLAAVGLQCIIRDNTLQLVCIIDNMPTDNERPRPQPQGHAARLGSSRLTDYALTVWKTRQRGPVVGVVVY